VVAICAAIEAQMADLSDDEKQIFLADMGLEEPGLDRLIRAGYTLLGLQTYFTAGPKEVRAWTVQVGATAPQAAGVIHTDFEHGFIRAEVISFADFVAARRAGRQGSGQDAPGGERIRRAGRRCHALSIQRLEQERAIARSRHFRNRAATALCLAPQLPRVHAWKRDGAKPVSILPPSVVWQSGSARCPALAVSETIPMLLPETLLVSTPLRVVTSFRVVHYQKLVVDA